MYTYLYIYEKISPKWKIFQEQKVFYFRFYILCENFSKIGPIIKKIPNFVNDPLNSKSQACDTANEHVLERHAAAVRQLSNGTNGDDLYIRIATVGNTIQTVNSPICI